MLSAFPAFPLGRVGRFFRYFLTSVSLTLPTMRRYAKPAVDTPVITRARTHRRAIRPKWRDRLPLVIWEASRSVSRFVLITVQ